MPKSIKRSARSKRLRAVQTSRHLRVSHHRHTGHVLPRHTTSYPLLAMLVLMIGVFLSGWTRVVTADVPDPVTHSYTVSASVPGPAPTEAAQITSAVNGQKFNQKIITLAGTCPANTYEKVYRNGVMSGIVLCAANQTFSLSVSLVTGANAFHVETYSLTDQQGPDSSTVTVLYSASYTDSEVSSSVPKTPNTQQSTQVVQIPKTTSSVPPLIVTSSDFAYRGVYVGKTAQFTIDFSGGVPPYAVSIDWGDGSSTLYSKPTADKFNAQHVYQKPGSGYKGTYVVTVRISDAVGNEAVLQLLAIVHQPAAAVGATSRTPLLPTPSMDYFDRIVRYVWPSYGIVVLMLTSFWLGERREYHLLKPRLRKTRHA